MPPRNPPRRRRGWYNLSELPILNNKDDLNAIHYDNKQNTRQNNNDDADEFHEEEETEEAQSHIYQTKRDRVEDRATESD